MCSWYGRAPNAGQGGRGGGLHKEGQGQSLDNEQRNQQRKRGGECCPTTDQIDIDADGDAPDQDKGTRPHAAVKQAHHDGSDHGGQSLWGQQQTRLVRRQASEHLQVLRQEKGGAEQTGHGDPADQVPDQKVPSLKESYIQQGAGRAKLERNEEQQEQQGQDDGTRHREPRSPAIIEVGLGSLQKPLIR